MPVNLIENFQLGTNLPLDHRYIVDDPYDASLYWFDGMQLYQPATGKLFVVLDTSLATIEDVLYRAEFDASYGVVDASIDEIYVDQLIQDASITNLRGRLNVVDGSITFLYNWNTAQDASIIKNYDDITALYDITAALDASIVRIDGSINDLFEETEYLLNFVVDVSLRVDYHDVSIINLDSFTQLHETSLGNLTQWNQIQDISIANLDSSLDLFVLKSGDTMTGDLIVPGVVIQNDLSVNGNGTFLGNVGIKGDLLVDGSTTFIHTDVLDVSIAWIHLNTGLTGAPPEWLQSGIVIERGDASAFGFIYDETRQEFRIGILGPTDASDVYDDADTQAVATREDTPIDNAIPFWNGLEYRFDTSTAILLTDKLQLDIDVSISQDLYLGGNFSILGDVSIGNNLYVTNYFSANNVESRSDASIGGNLKVDLSTYIGGNLEVQNDVSVNGKLDTAEFNVSGNGFPATPEDGDMYYYRPLHSPFWYDASRGKWLGKQTAYGSGRNSANRNTDAYMYIGQGAMTSDDGILTPHNGVITAASISTDTLITAVAGRTLEIRVNDSLTYNTQVTIPTLASSAYDDYLNLDVSAGDIIQAVLLANGTDNVGNVIVTFEITERP